jgi:plasmid stabilization system protein ParE
VSWRVLVREAAEVDLEQTRRWYNEQREGLGDEFLVSIAEAFTRLEEDPERYRMLYKGFRRVLVERFPYKVFYQVKRNNVIVFRVLYHARDYSRRL